MKKILLTGKTGFIGKNILPTLEKHYLVLAPSRKELNLLSFKELSEYIKINNFDVIVHCANPNPTKNSLDDNSLMLENSLRIFMNFYNNRAFFGKMIYLGSGAEYDKSKNISLVKEEEVFKFIPYDVYGFSKFIMNNLSMKSSNIYNLCLFACYGPFDHHSKFITHCINSCRRGEPITIRQDCKFDFLHVFDLLKIIIWLIENNPKHKMYNACSGKSYYLSEIAEKVKSMMESKQPIIIQKKGLNYEYTASNSRIINESGIDLSIDIDKGIYKQILWEKKFGGMFNEKKGC